MNVAEMLASKGSDVATISPERPVVEALAMLRDWGIGALVVSEDGRHIQGLLSERDIVRHLAAEGTTALDDPVRLLMSIDIRTCHTTDIADGLMSLMTERRIRHLPVADDDGSLCGVISIGDVVKSRVSELEVEQAQLIDYVQGGR